MMGHPIPLPDEETMAADWNGTSGLLSPTGSLESGYTDEEEDVITKHLAALGYVE